MKSTTLKKRIFTSIFFLLLTFLIFKFVFVMVLSLLILGILSILEFINLSKKIFKNSFYYYLFNFLFITFISIFSFLFFFFSNFHQLKFIILILLIGCIASDIGGYVFGKTFKGKKLTKISPKKTISGSIGSFLSSILLIPIFLQFMDNYHIVTLVFITLIISLISQIGDLFISFLKRRAKIKDTGSILQGHGGILDRLDGIIFALPFSYFLLKII